MQTGVRRYSEKGIEYLCDACANQPVYSIHHVCEHCIDDIEHQAKWRIEGTPPIKHNPLPFAFDQSTYTVSLLADHPVVAYANLHGEPASVLVLTRKAVLLALNLEDTSAVHICTLPEACLDMEGHISMTVSPTNRLVALTSRRAHYLNAAETADNSGVLFNLETGNIVMPLNAGDYHMEHAVFPVAFFMHGERELMIHATDWSQLDVTDPYTGECLTTRSEEEIDAREFEADRCSEWSGQLVLSPDGHRLATVGWFWHPIGLAYCFDIGPWLINKWEADDGKSKHLLAWWTDFWDSPLLWIDNQTTAIWGHDGLPKTDDVPMDSVALYNANNGERIHWFTGPTLDVFFYDEYLFSGTQDGKGISVWDVNEGSLLYEEEGIVPDGYHHKSRTFYTFGDKGAITLNRWRKI